MQMPIVAPSEVELADVHRVEGVVPGVLPLGQDIALRDRVVVQRVLGDEVLARHHVLHQLVALVTRVDGEEDVVARTRAAAAELAERRHDRGRVAVTDVVLAAVRDVAALADGRERHLG